MDFWSVCHRRQIHHGHLQFGSLQADPPGSTFGGQREVLRRNQALHHRLSDPLTTGLPSLMAFSLTHPPEAIGLRRFLFPEMTQISSLLFPHILVVHFLQLRAYLCKRKQFFVQRIDLFRQQSNSLFKSVFLHMK